MRALRSGFFPGKSLGTGASGSREISLSVAEAMAGSPKRNFGVGKSSPRGFHFGEEESIGGGSEVTELGAVERLPVDKGGSDGSESDTNVVSVSAGDADIVTCVEPEKGRSVSGRSI
jgi:hypothetical protein